MHPTFDATFYKIFSAVVVKCCLMWPIMSCDYDAMGRRIDPSLSGPI